MKKQNDYLMMKPSDFWRLDQVDIDGNYPHVEFEDFDVDPNFNCLVVEVLDNKAKELLTGEMFQVYVDAYTDGIQLRSNNIGMYSKIKSMKECTIKPSKASGIIYHLRDDAELLRSYADQLNEMMDVSSYYKDLYDREGLEGLLNELS